MSHEKARTWIQWTISTIVIAVLSSGLSNAISGSFQGGYQREVLPPNQDGPLSIRLSFRTLQVSGLLFLVNGSSSYIAVLVEEAGHLAVSQQLHNTSLHRGGDSVYNSSVGNLQDWRTLSFSLNGTALQVSIDGNLIFNHIISHSLTPQSVSFGGPESFFNPLYRHIPTLHFFIGCMRNVSIGPRDIVLDSKLYGTSEGCCIAPRYPAVCLNQTLPSLSLTISSNPRGSGATVSLSFRLQLAVTGDGVVLSSQSSSTAWLLQLTSGTLQLMANSSGSPLKLTCPGDLLAVGVWHQVSLVFGQSSLLCTVNNQLAELILPVEAAWPRTLLHVGGVEVSPSLVVEVQNGFIGCIQRLRVDDADIDPSVFVNSAHMIASVKYDFVDWPYEHRNASELVVLEHMQEKLSTDIIKLRLPRDEFRDALSPLYQQELERAVHLEAAFLPRFGHLFLGDPPSSVSLFTLHNVMSTEAREQVGYYHTGGENSTDVVLFNVWVGCADQRLAELPRLTLIITIEERGDEPRVVSSHPLRLVVGTRAPITTQVLQVEDPVISDPAKILFTIKGVTVQEANCSSCMNKMCESCDEAGALLKDDITVLIFSQNDVNNGLLAFQHYERFSTAVLEVRLSVAIQGRLGENMDVVFEVRPYPGELNLISDMRQCMFVKEEGMALVQPKHLTVESTFEDQSPVITYDLLSVPLYGVLQLWQQQSHKWRDLSSLNHTLLHSLHSFTQADIRAGHVRYVQAAKHSDDSAELFQDLDNFRYQVRSYNLSGPSGKLCINILPDAVLLQPSITIQLFPLVLSRENSSAPITTGTLNTSLDNMDFNYLSEDPDYENIDVQQLGIVYHLVEGPSYGALELGSTILTAGDNFTLDDIRSHRLIYRHFGTEDHQDSLTFYAEASSTAYLPIRAPNLTANLSLLINITATNNHQPVITVLEPIHPPEGMTIQVTSRNLNVVDADQPSQPILIRLRTLRKYTSIGMFALSSDPTLPVTSFSMEDILNGIVLFVHPLNTSAPLTSHQGIKVQHIGNNYIKGVINIEVLPLDLAVTVSVPANLTCIAHVDAEESVRLQEDMFDIRLSDAHGNDHNMVGDIAVSVASTAHSGQLFLHRANTEHSVSLPVSKFQFQAINSVTYVLGNGSRLLTRETLDFQFMYGHSTPVLVSLEFCVRPILLPLSVAVSSLELRHGGMEHLTSHHIVVTSSRPGDDGTLRVEVIEHPRYGSLTNINKGDGQGSLLNFTLDELHSKAVVYEHSGSGAPMTDNFTFIVCSENGCLGEKTLAITVYPVNVTVNDSQVTVREGSKYIFNITDFKIQAPPRFTRIKIIPEKPNYGQLKISTSDGSVEASFLDLDDVRRGRLFYYNDKTEHLRDHFEVLVEAESSSLQEETQPVKFIMRIYFEPVNNHAPEIVSQTPAVVQVVWGGDVVITSVVLSAHDYDSHNPDDELIWIHTFADFYKSFSNGYLYLDQDHGPPGNNGSLLYNWTEGDIRKNRLHYKHFGNPALGNKKVDVFILKVSDGEKEKEITLTVNIKAVIIQQDGQLHVNVSEGGSRRITHQYMHFSVQNVRIDDADFVITLTRTPRHGNLHLNGTTLHFASQFSQSQTARGLLEYVHDHSDTLADSFDVSVSVPSRGNEEKTFTFQIRVHRLDDNVPVVVIHNPLYMLAFENVRITNRTMSIEDSDAMTIQDYDKIVCNVTTPPTKGRLEKVKNRLLSFHPKNFTKYDLDNGGLYYHHFDNDKILHPDYFIFNVTDGTNHQPHIYNLSIVILPLVVEVTLKSLTVNEGDRAAITEEELMVSSVYLQPFQGLIMVQGSGPQHGRLVNSNTQQTAHTFSTEAIARRYIYYDHHGDENRADSFMLKYVVLDPAGFNRTSDNLTFHISITPVDDQPPVVNWDPTFLRLWAMETVPLTEVQFNVTDVDTTPDKLNFTVRVSKQDSYVAFTNNTAQFIHWFTQADLRARKVVLVHRNGPSGTISYTVWDSFHHDNGSVTVRADLLTLDCHTTNWRSIRVKYLGSVSVSTANLDCTTADDNTDREIVYAFSKEELLGHFEVNSQLVSSFNSTALRAGLVRYVHTQTAYWVERKELGVNVTSHPAAPADNLPVVIHIEYPQPVPGGVLAVNHGLHLTEGGSQCLNSSLLDARNVRYESWLQLNSSMWSPDQLRIVYESVEGPKHGTLTVHGKSLANFTQGDLQNVQAVCYTHDDSEMHNDKIVLQIQVISPDGNTVGVACSEEVDIYASPVNDLPPILESQLEKVLVQNFNLSLQTSDFSLSDGDTPPHLLFVHLASTPSNVDIIVNGSILTVGSKFSQDDVNLGRVLLRPHRKGESEFRFSYTDGAFTSPNSTTFVLLVEAHNLTLVSSADITYAQDQKHGTVITSQNLNSYTNGMASQTVFSLQQGPTHGRIVMGGSEVKSFTQEDIYKEKVSYSPHAGTQKNKDTFVLTVTNVNITVAAPLRMGVRVLVWGRVKPQTNIQFDVQATPLPEGRLPAIPLPADVLVLDELEKDVKNPPTIQIVNGPMFGHLERHVSIGDSKRQRRSSHILSEFRYEELQVHWIMYVWDPPVRLTNATVTDNIKVLVLAPPYQPGEAVISLNVTTPQDYPPMSTTPLITTTMSFTSPHATNTPSEDTGGGFPLFTLVPILGIICFLVFLVAVMVCFCLFQQKHRHFKFSTPGSLHSPHQSPPWSASPTLPPGQVMTYDLDPSGGHLPGEDQQHNSETSSGFSEPDASFHGSPVQSYPMYQSPSPSTYRQVPAPPRSRMRSNVSITFSSPRSTTSELSYEDEAERTRNLYTLSLPRYPAAASSTVTPVPDAAVSQPAATQREERSRQLFQQQQDHTSHNSELLQTDKNSELDSNSFTALPDIRDHDLNALFHAPNPVLKKEEYWI